MKIKHSLCTMLSLLAAWCMPIMAQTYQPSYKLIDTPDYYNEDLAVATYNVLDYGIDNTGNKDCTAAVQKLLDACGGVDATGKRGDYRNPSGGVVYFPAGRYLFNGQLVMPRGVTIRGDWNNPDKNPKIDGTVFMVDPTRGKGVTSVNYAFITMQPTTLVSNINFWYPKQEAGSISKYPATILYGQNGYWGNDYCNVRHCTFVNSYIGIQFNPNNGGGCPNVFDVYGTPLYEGLEIDCLADVGRFDGLNYAASYWENSGLPGAPAKGEIDSWLYENATGVVMRRNDWSYTCNFNVRGYKVGFHAQASPVEGRPNGHNYGFNLQDCQTGVLVTCSSGSGIMFANVNTPGCDTGVKLYGGAEGPVQFYDCNIDGTSASIDMNEDATSALMFQDCKVSGDVYVSGGHFQAVNNTFTSDITVDAKARCLLTDNKMAGGTLYNNSIFKCVVEENTGYKYPKLPVFEQSSMAIRQTWPAKKELYVVTSSEFGAKPFTDITLEPSTQADCAPAIQKALDAAGANGGGIVYLPVGHYPCRSVLVIPEGVELKGSGDIATVPKNNGSTLEVLTGEGDENGTPFITMAAKSGLRGVTINYPSQKDPLHVKAYPYSVRGNADCYVVNLAIRAAYRGLDLFTNKCDRHYVDYLAGHAFMNVVRIGGNSEDGVYANTQCNSIAYACGDESKFGCWPNSLPMADNTVQQQAYCQNERDLDFLIVGDCTREFLYNNFLFGCNRGMWFIPDNNGGAKDCRNLGNAVDGAVQTFVIDGVASDLNLVNSQIVALDHDPSNEKQHRPEIAPYTSAYFIQTGAGVKGKTINFFSSNNWGGGDYMLDVKGGTVNIAMTNMAACGENYTFKADKDAQINVFNGRFNNMKKTLASASDAPRVSVESSVIEYKPGSVPKEMVWKYNLLPSWEFENMAGLASRKGWIATASQNSNNAYKAIDGSASSRWDTGGSQKAGQWFLVNFDTTLTFNTIILDSSPSGSNDGPAAYKAEVCVDGEWEEVAQGTNGSSTTVITFPTVTASQVRIIQTGTKDNYWSINEFYVGNLETAAIDSVEAEEGEELAYDGRSIIVPAEFVDNASIEMYNMNGILVGSSAVTDTTVDVSTLPKGLYIAVVRTSTKSVALKFMR